MLTTAGAAYIVAVMILFVLWIYGLVSLYFDLRYRYIPWLCAWLRRRGDDRRHLI